MEGIARQPEAAGSIRGAAIILAALIEGFTFLAIIFVLLLGNGVLGTATAKGFVGSAPANTTIVAPEK
jgi:F0F1-type ATP synthase membrane subunit c/vacuolar-type H+-ATPase subunit K